jgi:hypothetical protein
MNQILRQYFDKTSCTHLLGGLKNKIAMCRS